MDDAFQIPDAESVQVCFDLLRQEGLCLGGSSGVNVAGAMRLARKLGPGKTIVTVLCDAGSLESALALPLAEAVDAVLLVVSLVDLNTEVIKATGNPAFTVELARFNMEINGAPFQYQSNVFDLIETDLRQAGYYGYVADSTNIDGVANGDDAVLIPVAGD